MKIITIDSKYTALTDCGLMPEFSQGTIKNEPMLFNCSFEGASKNGGIVTQKFLERLPFEWAVNSDLVIDSRVHMLMPGWYPCIPGWHHDDVPRTRADGQPNYDEGQVRSEHIMCLVNGDICPTEFATGEFDFFIPDEGVTVYEKWHKDVNFSIRMGDLTATKAPDRTLVKFNDRTWHQGTKAVANGWRWFIRASRYFDADGKPCSRPNPRTNELRRQVQVYLDDPNKGW